MLQRAAAVIEREGPYLFSLRSLAAELGVSHTAPRHHFGSREGVLNALAAQGFSLLGDRLRSIRESGGSFLDAGVDYVEFALEHRAHFQVMFAPTLLDETDPALSAARAATFAELRQGVDSMSLGDETEAAAAAVVAGWSIVHGFATLALTGNLDSSGIRSLCADSDLLGLARRSTSLLYGSPS